MRCVSWIGTRQYFSECNITIFCSIQIVIILYKLIDTVETRPQEVQSKIADAVPAQHDAFESSFITKNKIRESSKYYSSQTLRFVAAYAIKIPF